MSDDSILYGLSEGVATLTLNRPDRMNALGMAMGQLFMAALDRAVADGARAILLTGAGRNFCAGADLVSDGGLPDDLGQLIDEQFNPVMRRLAALDMPVVAAVNGAAAGAGCSLALSADFTIAAEDAYFLLAFANIGIVPDCGATWTVAHAIGRARALEMMMLAERIPAPKAHGWGLIHKIAPADELQTQARALAVRLAQGPTVAYGLIRHAVRKAYTTSYDEALDQERDDQRIAGFTQDSRAAMAAFVAKRKPTFDGK